MESAAGRGQDGLHPFWQSLPAVAVDCTVMATTADVRHELASLADPRRAEQASRFLQMIPGGYGEGDRAIGVSVPEQRRVAGRYWRDLSLTETAKLLTSSVHEERLTSLFILVRKFTKGDEEERAGSSASSWPAPAESTTGTSWTHRRRTSSVRG